MMSSLPLTVAALCCVVFVVGALPFSSDAQLDPSFYKDNCSNVHSIVREVIRNVSKSDPRILASLIRLHFHDYNKGGIKVADFGPFKQVAELVMASPNGEDPPLTSPNGEVPPNTTTKKRSRGMTAMKKVFRSRSKNVKLIVEWNVKGQPKNKKGGNTFILVW
ncbi:hypothetical protein RIF29_10663 [Crotalaria pallida]|uniref:Plant heme peroxidase family profile domain-containing protein n=1 Tax=Crotalaria pallida TaxID=3830 RepID=A0AAN9IK55_CROPI